MAQFSQVFSSLKHKAYRLLIVGQFISATGSWIQTTIQGWLVYELTTSAASLGWVGFVSTIPNLIFGLYAGVLADKYDKRKLVIINLIISAAQAIVLGVLTLMGLIQIWHIYILAFVLGASSAISNTARQSFVVELVGQKDLHNALALNSINFNITRIIGPAVAAALAAAFSNGWCFMINAAALTSVVFIFRKIEPAYSPKPPKRKASTWISLRSGFRYSSRNARLRNPLLLLLLSSFVFMPTITLLPAVSARMFDSGAHGFGLLISSLGVGCLFGGISLAIRETPQNLGRLNLNSTLTGAASLLLFSLSPNLTVACIAIAFMGSALSRQAVSANTIIQSLLRNDMRGRVMSIYLITFVGLGPVGNILWGYFGDIAGMRTVLAMAALWLTLVAYWFYKQLPHMKESERKFYIQARSLDNREHRNII